MLKLIKNSFFVIALAISLISCKRSDQNQIKQDTQNVSKPNFDELPIKFRMTQNVLSIGTDMDISSNGKKFGEVEQRTFSLGTKFELIDRSNKLIATAKQEVFSLYTYIEVTDSNGNLIGVIEQEVIESLFSLYSIYSIKDSNGKVIAKSKKLSLFTTTVEIVDKSGNVVVALDKDLISIGDDWDVLINGLDKRLAVFIPAFISNSQQARSNN